MNAIPVIPVKIPLPSLAIQICVISVEIYFLLSQFSRTAYKKRA